MPRALLAVVALAFATPPGRPAPLPGATEVRGVVFHDRNGNGVRDAGEPGVPGAVVSDQVTAVRAAADGSWSMSADGPGHLVFVSVPDGWRPVGPFWRSIQPGAGAMDFPLVPTRRGRELTFVHASDTHIAPATVPRMERLRALVDSLHPDFVIITGDLVRDALRVGEAEATGYYELFNAQAALVRQPLWTVPGNHENFGIERDKSKVSVDHPLYGRTMYRHYRGPDYYSFNAGGIHFVGLNSVDYDDTRYYGHVDSLQLAWLERDLALVPARMPVVTFNHIPFFSAMESIGGYVEVPPAPSLITVGGRTVYRHSVSNAREVIARLKGHPYPLALAGHIHVREQLRYAGIETRFNQVAAVVGGSSGSGLTFPSGIAVYRVRGGVVDDGTFVPLGGVKEP